MVFIFLYLSEISSKGYVAVQREAWVSRIGFAITPTIKHIFRTIVTYCHIRYARTVVKCTGTGERTYAAEVTGQGNGVFVRGSGRSPLICLIIHYSLYLRTPSICISISGI